MTFFDTPPDGGPVPQPPETSQQRWAYLRLVADVLRELRKSAAEEHDLRGLTQAAMADAIRKSESFISKRLSRERNLTLMTMSALGFAMERRWKVSLIPLRPFRHGDNGALDPLFAGAPQTASRGVIVTSEKLEPTSAP